MRDPEQIVIVGAGHAGGSAAIALRASGYRGRIALVGAEPHLPYERPPLSKELLQALPEAAFRPIKARDWYDEQAIALHLGDPVAALDPAIRTVRLASGTALSYDRLLLTTGGRVRRIDVPGDALEGVHYLRTLDDSRGIEARLTPGMRVVVIGGGFIGLEVAASARLRGAHVTVLEIGDRLMGRAVDPVVSAAFLALHQARGVDIRLRTGVMRFEGNGRVDTVVTTDDTSLPADMVVVGVGISPEVELAASAGLSVDNGIVVDALCRTADPRIFAAGDAVSAFNPLLGRHIRQESWQNAQNQPAVAARAMLGETAPYAEHPWVWSDQFDANLQIAGAPDTWDDVVCRGDPGSSDGFLLFQMCGGAIVGAQSVNRPRDMRFVRRLMAQGARPSARDLADDAVALKDIGKS